MSDSMYNDKDFEIFIKEEILWVVFREGCIVNSEVGERVIIERIKASKGVSYPVLVVGYGVKYWTMGSRNKDMKKQAYDLIDFSALVFKSKAIAVIWKYTTKIFKPTVPIRIFSEVEKAEKWVKEEMLRKVLIN